MLIPSNYIAIRPSFQRPLLIIFTIALVLITAEYSLSVMQRLRRFFLQLHDVLLEFRPTISHNVSDVRLLLWTRKSPMVYQQLIPWDPISLSTSSYNRSKPTKIMIHGFSDRSRYLNQGTPSMCEFSAFQHFCMIHIPSDFASFQHLCDAALRRMLMLLV